MSHRELPKVANEGICESGRPPEGVPVKTSGLFYGHTDTLGHFSNQTFWDLYITTQ